MRKAFVAIFTIALVSVMAGAGTFAYLTDVESSTGNSVEAGTFDLYLTDNGHVDTEWTLSNMVPGKSWTGGELNLHHEGSIQADHVEIAFTSTCSDPGYESGDNEESDTLDGANGMSKCMKVLSMEYESSSGNMVLVENYPSYGWNSVYLTDTNSNGFIDLDDLEGVILDDLPAPELNSFINDFRMDICFDVSAPNDYQGDECTLKLEFTLNQDASQ